MTKKFFRLKENIFVFILTDYFYNAKLTLNKNKENFKYNQFNKLKHCCAVFEATFKLQDSFLHYTKTFTETW